jgi:hypothetical protein
MDTEVWKDIPGYEGLYQASESGKIRSVRTEPPRILSQTATSRNYLQVDLFKGIVRKKYLVHRAVLEAFRPHPHSNKLVVNHIDRNTHNCALDNLEWETWGGNVTHYREHFDNDKRIAELEAWIEQEGTRSSTCTCKILNRRCSYCGRHPLESSAHAIC